MWNCPHCKRPFKNRNQQHSCVEIRPQEVLKDKSENVIAIYDRIISIAETNGRFAETATSKAIFLKNNGTFLAIKPMNNRIDLEFFLDREDLIFPVSRSLRISRNRIVHFISIDDVTQADEQLAAWIKESYELISGHKRQAKRKT